MKQQTANSPMSMKDKILYNSKCTLRPISPEIRSRIQSYNSLVKKIYGSYIENVLKQIRSFNDGQEYILPYSNISFSQASDYDNGTFEYDLHHHHSQQSNNPSISPFAGLSGLDHEQLISSYNSTTTAWDLAYNIDLSTRIVPFVDIDAHDHTNSSYYLNSYALDFFRHGSEKLLITENDVLRSETYGLLSDFFRLLSATQVSIDTIVNHEIKEIRNKDMRFFGVIGKKITSIQEQFWIKFSKEYK